MGEEVKYNMDKITELIGQKKELIGLKRVLNKDASLQTEDGAHYARCLIKLILIELQLDDMQKAL